MPSLAASGIGGGYPGPIVIDGVAGKPNLSLYPIGHAAPAAPSHRLAQPGKKGGVPQ